MQHTINKQLSQRFRNNRRRSSKAKSLKVVLPEANITATKENTSPDLQDEEDEENTQALQKLVKGKNPPAQTVQNLLIATRTSREKWLLTPSISIHDILEKYTVLRNSKWVCNAKVELGSLIIHICICLPKLSLLFICVVDVRVCGKSG